MDMGRTLDRKCGYGKNSTEMGNVTDIGRNREIPCLILRHLGNMKRHSVGLAGIVRQPHCGKCGVERMGPIQVINWAKMVRRVSWKLLADEVPMAAWRLLFTAPLTDVLLRRLAIGN